MPTPTSYFQQVAGTLTAIPAGPIEQIIATLQRVRAEGRRIFTCGNGGSSANASHFVNDMVKSTILPGRPRLKLMCLSDNISTLTAYANDVSYDVVFAEPLAALAEPGDVLIALSGSGNSPNVLAAMDMAQEMGITRIGLTGRDGGKLKDKCDICAIVPHDSMQVIEDAHLVILHAVFLAMCE
jgi:D-sedoheptulose 7-phosphate isomerase